MGLNDLVGKVQTSQRALQESRDALNPWERELASLAALGPTLSDEIAARKQAIGELDRLPPPAEEVSAAAEARNAYAQARAEHLSAQVTRLELQMANQALLVRLATMERDDAALRVSELDARNEALDATLAAKRAEEARAGREQAQVTQAQAASLPAALASLATENAELRSELEAVTLNTATVAEQRRVAQRRAGELEADLISASERIEAAGISPAVARVLDRRRSSLRDIRQDARQALGHSSEMLRSTDRRIDLGEDRRDLAIVQASADEIIQTLPTVQRQVLGEGRLRAQATKLVTAKRATIDELMEAYARYSSELISLDAAERQITTSANAMRVLIRQQLLWAQTLAPIFPADFTMTMPLLRELFKPAHWRQVAADIRSAAVQKPTPTLAGLLLFLVLAAGRKPARRALARLSELTGRIRTDAFRHTVFALILTILIAAVWPVGLAGLAHGYRPGTCAVHDSPVDGVRPARGPAGHLLRQPLARLLPRPCTQSLPLAGAGTADAETQVHVADARVHDLRGTERVRRGPGIHHGSANRTGTAVYVAVHGHFCHRLLARVPQPLRSERMVATAES